MWSGQNGMKDSSPSDLSPHSPRPLLLGTHKRAAEPLGPPSLAELRQGLGPEAEAQRVLLIGHIEAGSNL